MDPLETKNSSSSPSVRARCLRSLLPLEAWQEDTCCVKHIAKLGRKRKIFFPPLDKAGSFYLVR